MDIPFLPPLEWISRPVALLLILAFTIFQVGFISVTAYLLISWPLRRRERTRWILDLLDSGLRRGMSLRQCLADPVASGDRVFGYRYRMFAADLASGETLSEALKRFPSLVHPRVAALLSLGELTNTLRPMLAVCRHSLDDATARFHASRHYLMSFSILLFPLGMVSIIVLRISVLPKFRELQTDMGASPSSDWGIFERPTMVLTAAEWFAVGLVILVALSVLAGPWVLRFMRALHTRIIDALLWRLPWYRNRLLRDTTESMALLMDAGVPEAKALELAGSHQANLHVSHLTQLAAARLQMGESLPQALGSWDTKGELTWRIVNAQHSNSTRMSEALRGWWSLLDARAFRQEQVAAQLLICAVVIFNGWIVTRAALMIFLPIINIIDTTLVW